MYNRGQNETSEIPISESSWLYSKRSKDANNRSSFINVPYPALILRTTRAASYKDSNQLEFTQFTKTTPGSGRPRHNRVVIPNLVIDVTKLIAPSSQLERKVVQKRRDNLQKCSSIENGLDAVDAVCMEQFHLMDEAKMEFRIFKGLKSAWSVAYKYIEDLAASSSHINPHDDSYSLVQTGNGNISENSGNPLRKDDLINTLRFRSSNDNISQLSSSFSSLSDVLSHKNDFDDSYQTTESKHEVKMELISIICKPWKTQRETSGAKREEDRTQFGHSVYCKAGKDIFMEGEKPQFAPWVFYQSRNGVSPQVLLIENFGKWIDSLEKHHQHVDMQEVPMEIRRVLEDSYLFIYKQL